MGRRLGIAKGVVLRPEVIEDPLAGYPVEKSGMSRGDGFLGVSEVEAARLGYWSGCGLEDLAARYGVSVGVMRRVAASENWDVRLAEERGVGKTVRSGTGGQADSVRDAIAPLADRVRQLDPFIDKATRVLSSMSVNLDDFDPRELVMLLGGVSSVQKSIAETLGKLQATLPSGDNSGGVQVVMNFGKPGGKS